MKDLKFMDGLSSKDKYNNIYKYVLKDDLIEEVIYSERMSLKMDKLYYSNLIKNVKKKIRLKKVHDREITKLTEKVFLYVLYAMFDDKLEGSFSKCRPLEDGDLFSSRVAQCVFNDSKFDRPTRFFKFTTKNIPKDMDSILDFLRNECKIKDSMFLFTLKVLLNENDMPELIDYIRCIYLHYKINKPILLKSIYHPKNENIRKNSNKRYKEWGYEKYRMKFKDCFLMNVLRKDGLGFVLFTIREDKDYIEKILSSIEMIDSLEYSEVNNNSYIETDRHKIRHTERAISITRLNVAENFNKIRNCMKFSIDNITSVDKRYSGLQSVSMFIYDNKISTDISHYLNRLNKFIYKYGYRRLKVFKRSENKNHFSYMKDRYYNFDIYEMRKMSNISYSKILKNAKSWSIENNRKQLWLKFNNRSDTNFKGVFFRLLSLNQTTDPIYEISLSNFENEIDIHHVYGCQKDNTSDNLILTSKKSHILIESDKDLKEYDAGKYLTDYVKIKKLKYFRNKRKKNN